MSPAECPRCRTPDPWNFGDQVEQTFSKCLCGQRAGKGLSGLVGAIGKAYMEAEEEVRERNKKQAEAVHEYRLHTDDAYRARAESELQALVRQQQDAERASEHRAAEAAKRAGDRRFAVERSESRATWLACATVGVGFLTWVGMKLYALLGS